MRDEQLSMGGLLASKLGIEQGPRVTGLVLVNPIYLHTDRLLPVLPMLRYVVPSFPSIANDVKMVGGEAELAYDRNPLKSMYSQTLLWAEVSRDLAEITQPLLLMHSRVDNIVPLAHAEHSRALLRVGELAVRPTESHLGGFAAAGIVLETLAKAWDEAPTP